MEIKDNYIVTGSKDKSVCVTSVDDKGINVIWRGEYHDRVIKSVDFNNTKGNTLIASCGDDGLIGISDYRKSCSDDKPDIEIYGFAQPHSVVWGNGYVDKDNIIMAAGRCSDVIKIWDIRKCNEPLHELSGHTGVDLRKRDIHHPVFYTPLRNGDGGGHNCKTYVVSGGDGIGGLSVFNPFASPNENKCTAVSRGLLGDGCDSQAIAVQCDEDGVGHRFASSVGDVVHLLSCK
jgi:WD40 repeat protein